MFSTLLTAALLVAPAIQGALADFAVNSPALVQCKPARISWQSEGTKAPYNLIVVNAANPCGDALVEIGDFQTTFVDWTAKIPAGTHVQLSVLDANDNEAWSQNITVAANSDASCLQAVVSGASSAASTTVKASTTGIPTTIATIATAAPATTSIDNTYDSSSSDSGVVPIGAANAGTLQDSAAFTVRQVSSPLVVISGLVAVFALSL